MVVKDDLRKECRQVRDLLKTSKKAIRTSKHIIRDLKKLYDHVDDSIEIPKVKVLVKKYLAYAKDDEFFIMQKLDWIETINNNLKEFDLSLFHKMKRDFESLPDEQKFNARKNLEVERAKVEQEIEIDGLTVNASGVCQEYENSLKNALAKLETSDVKSFKRSLRETINSQRKVLDVFEAILNSEAKLMEITKKEVKQWINQKYNLKQVA